MKDKAKPKKKKNERCAVSMWCLGIQFNSNSYDGETLKAVLGPVTFSCFTGGHKSTD